MSKDNFTHLHVHTDYSLLDGCVKQEVLIEKAKSLGMKSLAFTEHGTLRGLYKQHENCSNIKGVRPIYGIEAYVTSNIEDKKERYGHMVLLAKNEKGLNNLFKLSSKSWLEGFYYRPRMQADWILENSEGLICSTACIGSYFSEWGEDERSVKIKMSELMKFKEAFGEDLYFEAMSNGLPQQHLWNQALSKASRVHGIPLILTNDVHYANSGDNRYQEMLFCIADKKYLSDPDRRRYDSQQFWFKTYGEMSSAAAKFCGYWKPKSIAAMLDLTNEIEGKCQASINVDRFQALLPKPELPKGFKNSFRYLAHLCNEGWEWRGIPQRVEGTALKLGKTYDETYQLYIDTLKKELKAFKKQRVVDYMLLVREIYQLAEGLDIMAGPGRGSAAGCLTSFLIGVTSIDPVYHKLLFERFLSMERIDLPDIDADFEDRRRDDLINACTQRWGEDNCARIATVSTLKGKQCITDVARALQVPRPHVDAVKSSIVERSSGDERASQTVEDSFKEFDVCRKFNEQYPDVLPYVEHLEGCCRNLGVHAAGIILSPEPLEALVPMEVRSQAGGEKIPVTGLDMVGCQALGLVKIDILGLKNLAVIKDALNAVEKFHDKNIDLHNIDINDSKTLDNFTARDFVGIFQYDTASAEKVCEDVVFTSFDDVSALVALNRPGTARSGLSKQYLERKKDPSKIKSLHPIVDEICKDTHGVLVYQEQVTKIFVELAGYAPATADSLRKAIAKKFGDETIGRETELFVKGAMERGCSEEIARKLMGQITFFGSYGFNMAHSVSYAMVSYWEMWLKTYYPIEFYWGLLANEKDKLNISRFIKDAKKHDIPIRPCDVNKSGSRWKLEDGELIGSLANIKNVGPAAVISIEAKQPYKSFVDFLDRVNRRRCNKRVIEYLIKGGAFDCWDINNKHTLDNLDRICKADPKKDKHIELIESIAHDVFEENWSQEEYEVIKSQVNPVFLGKHPLESHLPFVQSMRGDWLELASDDLWNEQWGFIYGQIVEIKYNRVGDFHSGEEPSEFEKKKQHWGARYANLNIEDATGQQQRMKLNVSLFDAYRHVVDAGTGTLVLGVTVVDKRWKSMRLGFLHDLLDVKYKLENKSKLDIFERVYTSKKMFLRRPGCYLITHIHVMWDKNKNEMCRVGLINRDSFKECVIFHSLYVTISQKLKPGMWIQCEVEKGIVQEPVSFTK